jgi:hypothetical protein
MARKKSDFEQRLRAQLWRVRQQVSAGNESDIVVWALPKQLACSQRPLRDHPIYGGRSPLPPEARALVLNWVERIKNLGIRSIISLLEDAQLERYYIRGGLDLHPCGLLGYYRSQRLEVRHFPLTDYQRPPEADMELVLQAFDELPKPVLLQCSAAIDRTVPVAAYIASKRNV